MSFQGLLDSAPDDWQLVFLLNDLLYQSLDLLNCVSFISTIPEVSQRFRDDDSICLFSWDVAAEMWIIDNYQTS